ncbi:hypothetical protein SAMN04244573_00228 [Azotobacter beijerinckii]|uniref:Phage terminase, small subunit n=1 Tax=Azotobacter beijerinckii TaxID=170623 RepID=A0A1H8ZNZ5_9GAMM|nr:hypothetical protein [Azotobacter beijerinckii]SEP66027.1 hypothetical protein SAMN04244573_00228 [Azotobacter beijerinckii]
MGKRTTEYFHHYEDCHHNRTNLALHMLALPLFVVACLVLASALLSLNLLALILGGLGLSAALALLAQGHRFETGSDPRHPENSLSHLLVEQFLTFPWFVLSGAWRRAWKACRRN